MALARNMLIRCVSLGHRFEDKVRLALFGLIAPVRNNSKGFWQRPFRALIPTFRLRPKQLGGLQLFIDPTDWSQTTIFEEIYLRHNYDLTKVRFTPEIVLDCGAHIGLFTLLAMSVFPTAQVTAFEPNPENVQLLVRQLEYNNLGAQLVQSAVSVEAGELPFSASNSHSGRLSRRASPNGQKVRTIDFPAMVKQRRASSALVKMDIEGEESRILPLLVPVLPRQSAIFFETHGGDTSWSEIAALLASHGFTVEKLRSRGAYVDGFASRE